MKVRTFPIFLSVVISSILLFGGWFVYQSQFVKKPIATQISAIKGIKLNDLTIGRDAVGVNVSFSDPNGFADKYKQIQKIVADKTNGKPVKIELNSPDAMLKKIWEQNSFAISEAMDLHTYSKIPFVLENMKNKYHLANVYSQMDDQNIYIYLNDGKSPYYAVLPRYKEVNRIG
ncbi:hypothetical protein PP175_09540 [Aneurinibacillus sp. Ricciae_BoGa-3]|uniref:hypothetical protein n=1 Tax=Aneurinibacillus sp. Ricciae_BoGa-3 TaxID=3022697 RepID=UPI00233F8E19|nr:hypothetical protein [Aneurinibacillus sp. Ricciae_BoGa-3]WCK56124.1 hypothetical protein PP175_09540 [Aneurinibacillus sp. Ricciae_BoGa-3]